MKFSKLKKKFLLVICCMALLQSLVYGVSNIENHVPVLNAALAFPFYQPLTFRRLAERIGVKVAATPSVEYDEKSSDLHYPLATPIIEKPEKPFNIVWLVSESLRQDMLTPQIMPALWDFSQKSHRFSHHYSGGNGTRMGLFSMFYGLYGPYWFRFLDERRSPLLMDVLQQQNYQLSMYTSAGFSYPEFDKTLFIKIPKENLHEVKSGYGWQRDRKNVTDMLSFIKKRDHSQPFMTFMFFESPHARYYFPEESVIRRPYLAELNYATMDLEKDIDLIYNRYINACHHLDSQLARVFHFLEKEKLLDNTIVLITGDHGEEFLENGHWGHNSEFTDQQIRVPLVLYVPGTGQSVVSRMTSHLDIAPTLLPLIGLKNSAPNFCLGYNLFADDKRTFTVISDWNRICFVDKNYKAAFPLKHTGLIRTRFTSADDKPLDDPVDFWENKRDLAVAMMKDLKKFRQQN